MITKIQNWIEKIFPSKTEFDNYQMIYSTTQVYLAEIIKMKLLEEGIHVVLINKKDTSYNNFGGVELYVEKENVIRAKYLINQSNG